MNQLRRRRSRYRVRPIFYFWMFLLAAIITMVVLWVTGVFSCTPSPQPTPTPTPKPVESLQPEPTAMVIPEFEAKPSDATSPDVFGFEWELNAAIEGGWGDGFNFGIGSEYSALEGVISFRGNNFRDSASYGIANIKQEVIEQIWHVETYNLPKGISGDGSWTGSGWTGQPIIVKWPAQTKAIMNMHDWAKTDDSVVEVIYATMDGHIYFINLEDGRETREPMNIGVPFKGAGSLDPRGYPLLYLGSGDHYNEEGKRARAMVVSLIDCEVIYEFGVKDDAFALRSWTAYDSSALVDAETDTLIYPGENGVLYVIKLNTVYDEAAGTISVSPSHIRQTRYTAPRIENDGYWAGYEGSAAAFGSYVFLTENSGLMHCVDLNTMQVVWVQDLHDDTNCSPVFEIADDGSTYLYIGATLDNLADANGEGPVSFFKLDAHTGEIVWEVERSVYTTSGVTGGIMTSAVLGRNDLDGLVIIAFASYGNGNRGDMVALDTETGEIVWELELSGYTWCSPVDVYTEDGKGYLVQCNSRGDIYLIDGISGKVCSIINAESNIEASPAVYNDVVVIGTRISGILGLRLK